MINFIFFNLKNIFSFTHIFVLGIYFSFSWFLAKPPLDTSAIYNSQKLTLYYDTILMSLAFFNFLLFVITHFNREMEKREIIGIRLSTKEIFWGLIISYLLFFFFGFVLPAYGIALIQQIIYAPLNINISIYFLKIISGLLGYTFLWIIISIWLFVKFRNDFTVLVIIVLLYLISLFVQFISNGLIFNQYWINSIFTDNNSFYFIITRIVAWFTVVLLSILLGNRIAKYLSQIEFAPPYRKGIFAKIANKCNAYLSMHHLNMMGLSSQKILILFSFIGFIFILFLIRNPQANLIIIAKIYLGAFIPILFSFNQYYLIKIDKEAGMVHNNFIRKISYTKIIFNRWLLLLIPQLLITLFFSLIISIFAQTLPFSFIIYILFLNVFCSLINLFFAVFTQTNSTANLFLLFFVYIQLRDDIQSFFISRNWLNKLNVFYTLLQENNNIPLEHWFIMIGLILVMIFLTVKSLRKINYADLKTH